jgi:hypothetical protein
MRGAPVPPVSLEHQAALETFAARHRLEPLLYLWGVLPAGRAAYLQGVARGERGLREGRRVIDALESAGVPVLPMRGPFVGHRWHGDVGARWFTDLDILVPLAWRADARAILGGLGYASRNPKMPDLFYRAAHLHYPLANQAQGWLLDLHWSVDHPFVRHTLNYDQIFAASRIDPDLGFRVATPVHEYLIQVAHLEKECSPATGPAGWARAAANGQLLGLLDLSLMLVQIDEQGRAGELSEVAARWGLAEAAAGWCAAARDPASWSDEPRPVLSVSALETAGGFRAQRLAELRCYAVPPPELGRGERLAYRLRATWHLASSAALAAVCLMAMKCRPGKQAI